MSTLLAILLFASTTLCATYPQSIEIDLVFPRANETYAPSPYFPIVFAVQNAGTAWPLGLSLSVHIRPISSPRNDSGHGNDDLWDSFNFGGDFTGSTRGNATADPSLFVHATNVTNGTEAQWVIVWSLGLENSCNTMDTQASFATSPISMTFNAAFGAAAPNLVSAVESCSSSFNLIEVDRLNSSSTCHADVISKEETGEGNPCGLKPLAQTIAANVSAAMKAYAPGTLSRLTCTLNQCQY
ncbi:hypothetical protein QBC33DRAFT_621352 [Phialemonium atrogriseum]|uniref:DUF7136 domain-containing protein n=1 Tax=Phialemonium atrogriseum TaxID=1093897 RepID=A0AAJ0FF61_9PEZI|nr:uncharacterized protein QBC33DRAFT_621352 [Phialemonium atrogriseum]KAK1765117.1 hypothetical protein QBC33DRAFT_621352 [Phialemonium atrogriseum]